jgi:SAM-dependent methyltransferase
MLTPDDIRWIDGTTVTDRLLRCPICGDMGPHRPVLEVPSMVPPHQILIFLRCPQCGSGHYDPPGISDFSDFGQDRNDFWRFYVESFGGVWETIWPILAEKKVGKCTLLDIGCGFGFAVDYWQRIAGGEAIGVELGEYGQTGAKLLGITVFNQLLEDCSPLVGRRFDVVYASEVIEHVPDPQAFAMLLARYVADDGVLIMTTPSAEFIQPVEHSPTLYAALAPGFHGFLLSANSFADIVRRCGFAHVDVRKFGERQMVWASREPLVIDPAPGPMLPSYYSYLDAHVAQYDAHSPVWQGLAYRSIKENVNGGRLAAARDLSLILTSAIAVVYGPDVLDPEKMGARLRECSELGDAGRMMPYFLPGLYYFLGAIQQHFEHDNVSAECWYAGAVACTLEVCRFGSTFFLEAISLIWPARIAVADIQLMRGDIDNGVRSYARLGFEGDTCSVENGFARASRDLMEARLPSIIERLLDVGAAAQAEKVLAGYRAHVCRRYGESLLVAKGVDQALADGSLPVPLDPLFMPCFAVILDYYSSGKRADASVKILEVVDVASRWSGSRLWGPRIAQHLNRARKLLPATSATSPSTWSFDLTYTQPRNDRR